MNPLVGWLAEWLVVVVIWLVFLPVMWLALTPVILLSAFFHRGSYWRSVHGMYLNVARFWLDAGSLRVF
jgi:hypothetical protein